MEPRLVVLTWKDAWCDAGAEVSLKDVHETHKPWTIHTIGWLLLEDEEGVSLANEKTGADTYRGRSFVPAGMVLSIKPYRAPRQPRTPRKPRSEPKRSVDTGPSEAQDNNPASSG